MTVIFLHSEDAIQRLEKMGSDYPLMEWWEKYDEDDFSSRGWDELQDYLTYDEFLDGLVEFNTDSNYVEVDTEEERKYLEMADAKE